MAEITDKIPAVTKKQMVEIEASFIKAYGKSYNRMRKSDLAIMIANQSTNYKKIEEQANRISGLGIMYMNRWKGLRTITRKKNEWIEDIKEIMKIEGISILKTPSDKKDE